MAFETVNVSSLKSALYSCKGQLNHSITDNLISSLQGNNWTADSKKNLIRALEQLKNNKYKNLTKKIDEYLEVTNLIEKYKNLQAENDEMQQQIYNLTPSLKTGEYVTETYIDIRGKKKIRKKWVETVNKKIQLQINNLTSQIKNNKNEMEILENKIKNMI